MKPTVTFAYDPAFDAWNTRVMLGMLEYEGQTPELEIQQLFWFSDTPTPSDTQVSDYLAKRWRGKEALQDVVLAPLTAYWRTIEGTYFERLQERMEVDFSGRTFGARLVTLHDCAYDAGRGLFGISVQRGTLASAGTVMHEVSHFAFHEKWDAVCAELGLDDHQTWTVKEAVTVLLNRWFGDLLFIPDPIFPDHEELRGQLYEHADGTRPFRSFVEEAAAYVQTHPDMVLRRRAE